MTSLLGDSKSPGVGAPASLVTSPVTGWRPEGAEGRDRARCLQGPELVKARADRDEVVDGLGEGRFLARHLHRLLDAVRPVSKKTTRKCGLVPYTKRYEGGTAILAAEGQGAHFSGLVSCKGAHDCPVCSVQKRADRRAELEALGAYVAHAYPDAQVGMCTFTLAHGVADGLPRLLDGMSAAASALRKGPTWTALKRAQKVPGEAGLMYVQYLDITHSWRAGWHPHYHVMVILPRGGVDAEALRGALAEEWCDLVVRELGESHAPESWTTKDGDTVTKGVHLEKLEAASDAGWVGRYVGKLGLEVTDAVGSKRAAKGHRTPLQIAEDLARSREIYAVIEREKDRPSRDVRLSAVGKKVTRDAALWSAFTAGFHRRRLHTGPEALALARSARAGQLFAEAEQAYDSKGELPPEPEQVAVLPEQDWRVLRHVKGARVHLLEAATMGGRKAVVQYVRGLQPQYVRPRKRTWVAFDGTHVTHVWREGYWWYPREAAERIREASAQDWPEDVAEVGDVSDFIDH